MRSARASKPLSAPCLARRPPPMRLNPFKALVVNPVAGVLVVLLVIFAVSSLMSPYFLSSYNLSVVARALAFVGLVTIGQASLMILGEIDLSLGTIGGLCGVVAGILMVNFG